MSVTTKDDKNLSVPDYGDYAGAGLEGVSQDEMLVPFLRILHYQCPQIDETDGAFIDGARPGMILNTATNQVINGTKDGMIIVPTFREHVYVEYTPRTAGGGFAGVWTPDDERLPALKRQFGGPTGQVFGKMMLDNGNELTESYQLYGIGSPKEDPDDVWRFIISFTSTQMRKYKSFVTAMNGQRGNPPLFAFRWQLNSVPEENKKGKYFGWRMVPVGGSFNAARMAPTDDLFQTAAGFYEMLRGGKARANYEASGGGSDDGEGGPIPF